MVDRGGQPTRRLLVRLRGHPDHTESVDYRDLALLAEQLRFFELRRRFWSQRPPDDPHTFWNGSDETLTFSDDSYISHEVVDITQPEKVQIDPHWPNF